MIRAPLDNNATERGRGVGRKNHYGSRSKRGTEVDALFYSLIESAKVLRRRAQGVSAAGRAWALASPGTVTLPPAAARLTPPPHMSRHRGEGGFPSRGPVCYHSGHRDSRQRSGQAIVCPGPRP